MTEAEIKSLLDQKATKEAVRNARRMEVEAGCRALISPDTQKEIDRRMAALAAEEEPLVKELSALDNRIVKGVLDLGVTVKGSYVMAVWSKGRTTWDSKMLRGYAEAHPEIKSFCKIADPTVSLRKIDAK